MSIFIYFEEQMLFSPSRPLSWNPPPVRRRKTVPLISSYMLNFITTMKALICCGLDSCVWYTSCSVITLPEKCVPRPFSSHTTFFKHPLRWCVLVGVYLRRVREIPSHTLLHLTANFVQLTSHVRPETTHVVMRRTCKTKPPPSPSPGHSYPESLYHSATST